MEQIVTFETAGLACQAGFDREVEYCYNERGEFCKLNEPYNVNKVSDRCSAPSQSVLSRWLREVKHISLEVAYNCVGKFWVCTYTCDYQGSRWLSNAEYANDFESALEAGLLKALKILLTI